LKHPFWVFEKKKKKKKKFFKKKTFFFFKICSMRRLCKDRNWVFVNQPGDWSERSIAMVPKLTMLKNAKACNSDEDEFGKKKEQALKCA